MCSWGGKVMVGLLRVLLVWFVMLILVHVPFAMAGEKHRILLNIDAEDAIKNQLTSYITRELRSLGDVVIVQENPHWSLDILGIELSN
jgi:hypothetical protein